MVLWIWWWLWCHGGDSRGAADMMVIVMLWRWWSWCCGYGGDCGATEVVVVLCCWFHGCVVILFCYGVECAYQYTYFYTAK